MREESSDQKLKNLESCEFSTQLGNLHGQKQEASRRPTALKEVHSSRVAGISLICLLQAIEL